MKKELANIIRGQGIFILSRIRKFSAQSSVKDNINAKFCDKLVKVRVVKRVGNDSYELEDLKGRGVRFSHEGYQAVKKLEVCNFKLVIS